MKKMALTIGIIIVVLIGAGAWLFSGAPAGEIEEERELDGAIEVRDTNDVMVKDEVTESVTEEVSTVPAAEVGEAVRLAAIPPYEGTGVANRSFVDGVFTHVVAADLPAPAAGKFYEGWLVHKTASGPQFFSTGKLDSSGGAAWTLVYSASQDYPDHNDVVITEETEANGLDNKPEAHVLEGTF